MILTRDQIQQLTGKRYSDAQRRQLDFLRIPYRVRKDGSPVVLLSDLEPQARMQREPELMP
jgi:hypothetical protein